MKALDIVASPRGTIGIISVTGSNGTSASVDWIHGQEFNEKSAWWDEDELTVIDSLPRLLATALATTCGHTDANRFFPKPDISDKHHADIKRAQKRFYYHNALFRIKRKLRFMRG